jgi:hypothetical protein
MKHSNSEVGLLKKTSTSQLKKNLTACSIIYYLACNKFQVMLIYKIKIIYLSP